MFFMELWKSSPEASSDKKFDIITANHVIDVPDPWLRSRAMRQLLAPEGFIGLRSQMQLIFLLVARFEADGIAPTFPII